MCHGIIEIIQGCHNEVYGYGKDCGFSCKIRIVLVRVREGYINISGFSGHNLLFYDSALETVNKAAGTQCQIVAGVASVIKSFSVHLTHIVDIYGITINRSTVRNSSLRSRGTL